MKGKRWVWWMLALAVAGVLGVGEGGGNIVTASPNLKFQEVPSGKKGIKVFVADDPSMGQPVFLSSQFVKVFFADSRKIYNSSADPYHFYVINGKQKSEITDCTVSRRSPIRFFDNSFALECNLEDIIHGRGYSLFDYKDRLLLSTPGYIIASDKNYFYYDERSIRMEDTMYLRIHRISKNFDRKTDELIFTKFFNNLKNLCLSDGGNFLYLSLFKNGVFYFKTISDINCRFRVAIDIKGKVLWEEQK